MKGGDLGLCLSLNSQKCLLSKELFLWRFMILGVFVLLTGKKH